MLNVFKSNFLKNHSSLNYSSNFTVPKNVLKINTINQSITKFNFIHVNKINNFKNQHNIFSNNSNDYKNFFSFNKIISKNFTQEIKTEKSPKKSGFFKLLFNEKFQKENIKPTQPKDYHTFLYIAENIEKDNTIEENLKAQLIEKLKKLDALNVKIQTNKDSKTYGEYYNEIKNPIQEQINEPWRKKREEFHYANRLSKKFF